MPELVTEAGSGREKAAPNRGGLLPRDVGFGTAEPTTDLTAIATEETTLIQHRYLNLVLAAALLLLPAYSEAQPQDRPNVLVIWGDDIGTTNISYNNRGLMGYRTPNIDRIAEEGLSFTDYYAQQSCTAGRAAFLGGNNPLRTGMTKVGVPGASEGWQASDVTIATVMKSLGYATGQFGKNQQGDRDEHLPTSHGFDEFFGNLYHLNAEEEPENEDYPADLVLHDGRTFLETFGPRGVIRSRAVEDGGQEIEDTGPLTRKRMETIDDETLAAAIAFMEKAHSDGVPFFVWWNGTRMHFRMPPCSNTVPSKSATTVSGEGSVQASAWCEPFQAAAASSWQAMQASEPT